MEQQRSHFSEEREDEQEATFEGTTIRLEQEKRLAETLEDVQRSMQKLSEHLEGAAEQKAAEPDLQAPPSAFVPELSRTERSEVARRGSPKALIVLETIREEGENELARAPAALAVSGLAAGLSMGFSVLGEGLLRALLPLPPWRELVANLGYSLGFLIVVLGRQQLFTENTLTVIVPLLARPGWAILRRICRLWTIVFLANLAGGFLFAWVLAHSALFPATVTQALTEMATQSLQGGWGLTVLRGIFAGWLIALMIWLLPAAEGARFQSILLLTYFVALGHFAHIIVGSIEVFYLLNLGGTSWLITVFSFILPTLLGNSLGGVLLVALLNAGQVAAEMVWSRERHPTDASESAGQEYKKES